MNIPKSEARWGWHFVLQRKGEKGPMLAKYGNGKKDANYSVAPGFVYQETAREILVCHKGLHASERLSSATLLVDAIIGFPDKEKVFLCMVRSWGKASIDPIKIATKYREVVQMVEIPKRFFGDLGHWQNPYSSIFQFVEKNFKIPEGWDWK